MKRIRLFMKLAVVASLVAAATQSLTAGTITDGFEGSSISSFWTASGPGTAALTSTAAHSGSQSVSLQVSSTFPWDVELNHDYGSEQVGSVSVYMEVPAGPNSSASDLEIDDAGVPLADIQENANGSFFGRILPASSALSFSYTASSPNGWNLLTITTSASGVVLSIDGTVIGSSALVTSFRIVSLQNYAGPTGGAFFDDFSASTSSVAPEPSTAYLMALGGLICAIALPAWRRRAWRKSPGVCA